MPRRCLLRPSEDGRAGEGRREREEAYHPGNEGVKTVARYGAAIYSVGSRWVTRFGVGRAVSMNLTLALTARVVVAEGRHGRGVAAAIGIAREHTACKKTMLVRHSRIKTSLFGALTTHKLDTCIYIGIFLQLSGRDESCVEAVGEAGSIGWRAS